jgi:hypothetical protein
MSPKTTASKQHSFSKLISFTNKSPLPGEHTRLIGKTEEQAAIEQKDKELIMKYRNMTLEEVERYLVAKQNGEFKMSTMGSLFLADAWGTWS